MRPDKQRTLGKGDCNAFVSTVGLWEASDGIHLRIDMTPADAPETATNRPGSVRNHRIRFWDLREMLMVNGCWVLGDQGADAQASGSGED